MISLSGPTAKPEDCKLVFYYMNRPELANFLERTEGALDDLIHVRLLNSRVVRFRSAPPESQPTRRTERSSRHRNAVSIVIFSRFSSLVGRSRVHRNLTRSPNTDQEIQPKDRDLFFR